MQFLQIGQHYSCELSYTLKEILVQENLELLNDKGNNKKYIKELKAIILKDQSIAEEKIKSCIPSFIHDFQELNYFQ